MLNSSSFSFNRTLAGIILLSLVGLFLASSEWLIRSYIEPNDNFQKALNLLEATKKKNAIFGDSRIAFGFSGGDQFVNLGFQAETILSIEKRVERYLENVKPEKVILQADPHMFSFYRLNEVEGQKLIKPDWTLRVLSEYHRKNLIRYWATLVVKRTFESKYKFHDDGWQNYEEEWRALKASERKQKADERASVHSPIPKFETSVLAEAYKRVVGLLLKSGSEICLVTTPVSVDYLGALRTGERINESIAFFKKLAQSRKLKYISMLDSYAQAAKDGYFSDPDHLNEKGTKVFSNEVQKRCFG